MLHALEHGATSRRGLRPGPDRQLAPCRVAPAGVDQHEAGRLLRVLTGEQAREHPAVGVPTRTWRPDAGGAKQPLQIGDLVARVVHAAHRQAVAEPGAVWAHVRVVWLSCRWTSRQVVLSPG